MGTLYLVRHGQASFGSDDYDRLSPLGHRQARALGEHFRSRGLRFERVASGTLRRHRETWQGIAAGLAGESAAAADHQALVLPGLDEYHPEALVRAVQPDAVEPPRDPAAAKAHFRLLREGLLAWMQARTRPQGLPSFAEFSERVGQALASAAAGSDGPVLVVTSGGPIAAALGRVLQLGPEATVDLNLRIRNSSVTELLAGPKRLSLLSFNGLPHLDPPERADWVTYA